MRTFSFPRIFRNGEPRYKLIMKFEKRKYTELEYKYEKDETVKINYNVKSLSRRFKCHCLIVNVEWIETPKGPTRTRYGFYLSK